MGFTPTPYQSRRYSTQDAYLDREVYKNLYVLLRQVRPESGRSSSGSARDAPELRTIFGTTGSFGSKLAPQADMDRKRLQPACDAQVRD